MAKPILIISTPDVHKVMDRLGDHPEYNNFKKEYWVFFKDSLEMDFKVLNGKYTKEETETLEEYLNKLLKENA